MAQATAVQRKMKVIAAIRFIIEVLLQTDPNLVFRRPGSNFIVESQLSNRIRLAPMWLPTPKVCEHLRHVRTLKIDCPESAGRSGSGKSTSGNEPRPKKTCHANEFNNGNRNSAHPSSNNAGD